MRGVEVLGVCLDRVERSASFSSCPSLSLYLPSYPAVHLVAPLHGTSTACAVTLMYGQWPENSRGSPENRAGKSLWVCSCCGLEMTLSGVACRVVPSLHACSAVSSTCTRRAVQERERRKETEKGGAQLRAVESFRIQRRKEGFNPMEKSPPEINRGMRSLTPYTPVLMQDPIQERCNSVESSPSSGSNIGKM
jgi:hypothetical protein